jgi:hypothetical protein
MTLQIETTTPLNDPLAWPGEARPDSVYGATSLTADRAHRLMATFRPIALSLLRLDGITLSRALHGQLALTLPQLSPLSPIRPENDNVLARAGRDGV